MINTPENNDTLSLLLANAINRGETYKNELRLFAIVAKYYSAVVYAQKLSEFVAIFATLKMICGLLMRLTIRSVNFSRLGFYEK